MERGTPRSSARSGRTAEANADSFIRVGEKGLAWRCDPRIRSAEPNASNEARLTVTGLHKNASAKNVFEYLREKGADIKRVAKIKTRFPTYSTMYVEVSKGCEEVVKNPQLWDRNTLIKDWRGRLIQETIIEEHARMEYETDEMQ